LQSCKGAAAQEEPTQDKPRIIRENLLLQVHNARAVVRLYSTQPRGREAEESAGPQKQQDTNKASGQSMQANVNNNTMDDMYVAFTMVQQIMTGLSGAASEEEKVSVIIKAVLVY
jgi:hypothetical protein